MTHRRRLAITAFHQGPRTSLQIWHEARAMATCPTTCRKNRLTSGRCGWSHVARRSVAVGSWQHYSALRCQDIVKHVDVTISGNGVLVLALILAAKPELGRGRRMCEGMHQGGTNKTELLDKRTSTKQFHPQYDDRNLQGHLRRGPTTSWPTFHPQQHHTMQR